jgi:OPT family oligopeptide transporter
VRFVLEFYVSRVLAFVYTIPIGVISATTSQRAGLNVITELIIGYALPGRPIAMMLFKTWGHNTMVQALQFMSDLKLAHYTKVAHRPIFFCQVVGTIVAGTVQLGVQAWMFSNIEDLCTPDQKEGFSCPGTAIFGTASIIVSLSSCGAKLFVPVAQSLLLCCSGVSLGHSVCYRTASSTSASSSSSLSASLHRYSSGFCTRSSGSASSSTSIFRSSSPPRAPCLP